MDLETFYSPLAGSFLGVIGAFAANYALQWHFANNDRIKFINMIISELNLCITTLELDRVEFLPVGNWTSAVNSGALKLFKADTELQSLSTAYQKIKNYNQVALSEHFYVYDWERLDREDGNRLSLMTVRRFQRNRQQLIEEIRELITAEWLNPSNEPAPGYNDDYRYEMNERH
jgi:hypothetical protein